MKKIISFLMVFFFVMMTGMTCFAKDQGNETAIITDFKGPPLYEAGKKKGQEVRLADFVEPGDIIRLKPGNSLVLYYFDPVTREDITGPGSVTVGKTCSRKSGDVKISSKECSGPENFYPVKLFITGNDSLVFAGIALRGEKSGPEPIGLLKDTFVRPGKPFLFRWTPVKDAEKYELGFYDSMNNSQFKTITHENHFAYDVSELKDEMYFWTVSASANGKAYRGEGTFSILSKDVLAKLTMTEEQIRARYPEDSDELLLRLAMVYRYYELNAESADMLRELYGRHPRSQNIRRWLEKVSPVNNAK